MVWTGLARQDIHLRQHGIAIVQFNLKTATVLGRPVHAHVFTRQQRQRQVIAVNMQFVIAI